MTAKTYLSYGLLWVSADKQGSVPMGDYLTAEDAEASIPWATQELLGQCATAEQRASIRAGRWEVIGQDYEALPHGW